MTAKQLGDKPAGEATLREMIAANCLQGLLADNDLDWSAEKFAQRAFTLADALLEKLAEETS